MIFSKVSPLLRSIALALASAAVGFTFGLAIASHQASIGCRLNDLTQSPDTSFLSIAASHSTSESASPPTSAVDAEPKAAHKYVCLTFDDGPSKTTPAVLSVLEKEAVPATFFVVATGYNDKYLPLIRQAQQAGHQIALHSASHDYGEIYASSDDFWNDINLLKDRISPYTDGEELEYLRFPGGSTNTVSRKYGGSGIMKELRTEAEEMGYHWVDWNVCAEDAAGHKLSAEEICRNIIKSTGEQEKCIVLMHDSASTGTTADALPAIIQWYKEHGYTFCTVAQLYEND